MHEQKQEQQLDSRKHGLRCGLEIHQQLEGRKLFCRCPTKIIEQNPDFTIRRRLRAAAGETEEIDLAAAHEMGKGREFIYQGYNETTCLVELDESPPLPFSQENLATAVQIAKMLHCSIVDEIQVMRKTVVDGSNTSGFQRTALIGMDGWMELKETGSKISKRISIPTVCIEEDACRIIERGEGTVTYRLDRLGIPLIEIATGPDIDSPEEAKEVAAHIGMILRSTGKVKRGLGTIRQDVNVSIAKGQRAEIKGAQDLKLLPEIVRSEVQRQVQLMEIFSQLSKQGAKVHEKIHDVTRIFEITSSKLVQNTIKKGGKVLGIRLEGFHGLLGRDIQPGRRFGTELSDHAKTAGVMGLIHSDEDLSKYSFSHEEVRKAREELGADSQDAFILVADKRERAEAALQQVIARARQFTLLKEVRNANDDGTSSFLRPMPGAARMYPETDLQVIRLSQEFIDSIAIPELIEQKTERFERQYGLSGDVAADMAKNHHRFEEYASRFGKVKPTVIARYLGSASAEVKTATGIEVDAEAHIEEIFPLLENGKVAKEALVELLASKARGEKVDLSRFGAISDEELKEGMKEIVSNDPSASVQALMGEAMKLYRGKADGKRIMGILKALKNLENSQD